MSVRVGRIVGAVCRYTALIAIVVLLLFPIYWMFVCSFMPSPYLSMLPPHFLPDKLTLENYQKIFSDATYMNFFKNSFIVSIGTVTLALIVAIPAGYSFSRYSFKFKHAFQSLLMSVQMFPTVVILISLYVFYRNMGLLNTYQGLILADATFTMPLSIMLSRSFFDTVPRSIDDAARIDGASRIRTILQIAFPLVLPGVVAVAIYTFLNAWDSYTVPLILMTKQEMKTLPIGISETFLGEYSYNYGGMMAFAFAGTLPIVLIFIFLQKYMIAGLTAGAVKG
ncbi:MAG: carbohydrate ABC transporter permease [Clostridiales bacterium]|nr:carbohydrate ABC transporter permease [Clostridiales bacterium]